MLSIPKGGFVLGSLWKTFKSRFGYDLDYQIAGYENVHKILEAMLECVDLEALWGPSCCAMHLTPWEDEHDSTMQFFVQIESTKKLDNNTITGITTTTLGMMMVNPPTRVEHNNDFIVNGISLKCSPPKWLDRRFDKEREQIL